MAWWQGKKAPALCSLGHKGQAGPCSLHRKSTAGPSALERVPGRLSYQGYLGERCMSFFWMCS